MSRSMGVLGWIGVVVCWGSVSAGQQEPGDAAKKPSQSPAFAVTLTDGNVVPCRMLSRTIPVTTDFGTLTVPAGRVLAITHGAGPRVSAQTAIPALVAKLGHDVFEEREKAQQALLKIGPAAVPALTKAAKSEDAEQAERATRLLEQIGASGGDAPATFDTVVTDLFTIKGRVALDAYDVQTVFGKQSLALAKVAKLVRGRGHVPTLAFPASVQTNAEEAKHWRCSVQEEAGWTQPLFDDGGWVGAKALAGRGGGGIDHPQPELGKARFFRRCFVLERAPSRAELTVTRPKTYELFVNGNASPKLGRRERSHNITKFLNKGRNVIAVKIPASGGADTPDPGPAKGKGKGKGRRGRVKGRGQRGGGRGDREPGAGWEHVAMKLELR